VALLLGMATVFGSNHVAARVAFEHGANVMTAVAFRSTGTALVVLGLLLANGVPLRVPRATFLRALLIGLVLAVQSYCLYSAVALIPVALALLAFQTFPMVLALLSGRPAASGGEARVVAMSIALAGLTLALDVVGRSAQLSGRWSEIGPGVLWAFGASLAFALVLFLTRAGWRRGRAPAQLLQHGRGGGGDAGCRHTDRRLRAAGRRHRLGSARPAHAVLRHGDHVDVRAAAAPGRGEQRGILNFEPIAVLAIAWVVLGQAVTALQALGAFVVVGAIMWMGAARK